MHIGFDAKRAFHNFSGLGNYSRTLIQSLAQYYPQNKYFLYSPSLHPHPEITHLFQDGYILKSAPKMMPHALWRSRFITSDIKRDKLEIFHGLSHELPMNIQKSGVYSIVTIHDLIFLRYPELYATIDRKIYKAKIMQACRQADKIIAISEQTKRDIIQFTNTPEEKIAVVYQSCAPTFHPNYSRQEVQNIIQKYQLPQNYLLYVGTIEERKNLLLVAKALKKLPKEIKCVVIGKKKDYYKIVQDFLQKEHLIDRIIFPEIVAYQDLPFIFSGADIFIYPSRFEGFGIPILEAISSGIPVIAAKGSCLEEAGGPDSLYVHPDDESALAEAISQIKSTTNIAQKMAEKGLQYAAQFSLQNTAASMMTLYEKGRRNV